MPVLIALATLLLAAACGGDEPPEIDATTGATEVGRTPAASTATASAPRATATATSTSTPTEVVLAATATPTEAPTPTATPEADLWLATISGTIRIAGCTPVSQSGGFVLIINPDGTVYGTGGTTAGAYTCDNGASIPEQTISYTVTGRKTDRFVLTFSTGGPALGSSIIVRGEATIEQDTGAGIVTIQLKCENC